MSGLAYEHNGASVAREAFYAIACDPRRQVAVEACAGAGKTWMLVSRILRALLDGAEPQDILAITFTRKAAGEMRQRLQEWLAAWSQASDAQLTRELALRGLPRADAAQCEALRGLYARLLANGRPVQIRTFHSWFAALLRGAPIAVLQQLGLPTRYELLETDAEAVARVWRPFHAAVERDPQARADFEASVARHGRASTRKALEAALARRVEFAVADARGVVDGSVQPFDALFPEFAGLPAPEHALDADGARARWHGWARALGAEKNKTPQRAADAVVLAFEHPDLPQRLALLRRAFFVAEEDRLTQHLVKVPAAAEAEAELQRLCAASHQHEAWRHHQRMVRLARLLLEQYAAMKREQGWVDMNDVERAAHALLSDAVLSGWVQERLDQRVRHLLIDEFQDTNALQWQALHAWLASYAGAGAGGPSVFIVGDPKQSIYRFRRAEPQVFAAAQVFVRRDLQGDLLSCDHTHRNAPAVLQVVNAVMGAAQADGQVAGFRAHTTESQLAGQAWALPVVPRPPRAAAAGQALEWRDSLTTPRQLPEERLVALECRQAAAWLAAQLAVGLAPADVMVLARKRERLSALQDELRSLHIPAQQPEKSDLCDAPEVQDLTALLDVLVSPAHDLSLARALRSPLFGCADDDLVWLAQQARDAARNSVSGSWLDVLLRNVDRPPALAAAAERLRTWRGWVQALPPHDALQAIYAAGDVLARFAQAAPAAHRAAVLGNLRALLGAALQADGGRYLTPYAFVRALKAGGLPGPAVAASGVVRLLTVHGAKGLEAPVVVLLDTDAAPARAEAMGVLCEWPGEAPAPLRFAFLASEARPPLCCAAALAAEQQARAREELNALYVAMTRAQRTLVLSSVAPVSASGSSWWQRLLPHCTLLPVPDAARPGPDAVVGPDFLLPVVPSLPATSAVRPGAPDAAAGTPASRFGEAVHHLLETGAPGTDALPAQRVRQLARRFGLDAEAAQQAVAMAQRIVQGEGAWAWDARLVQWQGNEVELLHQGELLRIDRLVRRSDTGHWWVLDFKSASRPQGQPELLAQLRRYRAALLAAEPGAVVRTAFLTGAGQLLEVS